MRERAIRGSDANLTLQLLFEMIETTYTDLLIGSDSGSNENALTLHGLNDKIDETEGILRGSADDSLTLQLLFDKIESTRNELFGSGSSNDDEEGFITLSGLHAEILNTKTNLEEAEYRIRGLPYIPSETEPLYSMSNLYNEMVAQLLDTKLTIQGTHYELDETHEIYSISNLKMYTDAHIYDLQGMDIQNDAMITQVSNYVIGPLGDQITNIETDIATLFTDVDALDHEQIIQSNFNAREFERLTVGVNALKVLFSQNSNDIPELGGIDGIIDLVEKNVLETTREDIKLKFDTFITDEDIDRAQFEDGFINRFQSLSNMVVDTVDTALAYVDTVTSETIDDLQTRFDNLEAWFHWLASETSNVNVRVQLNHDAVQYQMHHLGLYRIGNESRITSNV